MAFKITKADHFTKAVNCRFMPANHQNTGHTAGGFIDLVVLLTLSLKVLPVIGEVVAKLQRAIFFSGKRMTALSSPKDFTLANFIPNL